MCGGDVGLKQVIERVYHALVPGGTFVLEAQPRESYTNVFKLLPVRAILRLMNADFSRLASCGVDTVREHADTSNTARTFETILS